MSDSALKYVHVEPIEQFAAQFLSHFWTCNVPPFHREMYRLASEGHRRIVICAPRSFAKSTVFSVTYPLFQILHGTETEILIVSATGSLAENWLGVIRRELESNGMIREDYGNGVTDKWTQSDLVWRRGDGSKVRIRAKGAGHQIRGFRPGIIIVDDIETDEGVRSEDQREKLMDWFNKALLNTLEKDSQLIYIGTLLHPLALLNNVMQREGWVHRKYQAITDGRSLWPEKWPLDALEARKREIGSKAFNSEFQNDPIISDNPIFVRDWFGKVTGELSEMPSSRTVIACDPAISRKEASDFTALVGISSLGDLPSGGPAYRVDGVLRGHWPLNETVNQLIGMYDRLGASTFVIETTAYQQALADELRRELSERNRVIQITEIKPDRDKERRAHAIVPMLERGEVFFDYDDIMQQKLMDELFLFPTAARDDMVDAFVYAMGEFKRYGDAKMDRIGPDVPDNRYEFTHTRSRG